MKQKGQGRKQMKTYDVINLLGEVLATFNSKKGAHAYADTLINYAYVEVTK